jgi:hypothetical protein
MYSSQDEATEAAHLGLIFLIWKSLSRRAREEGAAEVREERRSSL